MPYDKYRNWPLPIKSGNIFPVFRRQGLEEQVLEDLAAAGDKIDKLEILDSYAACCQRAYRKKVAEALSFAAGRIFETLLEPNILPRLPEVDLFRRGRPATKEPGETNG